MIVISHPPNRYRNSRIERPESKISESISLPGGAKTMDRALASKWLLFIATGLAVLYLWNNYYWLSNAIRVGVDNWWR